MAHAASAFAFPNLMIEHPWTSKDHSRHRNRITEMKPSIDCTVPSSYYVMINRAKKDQQNEEWCARVDRDNELLLSRMAHVMTHHSILAEQQESSKQTWHHVSPNELNRKAEQRRIEVENKKILGRLKTKESSYPAAAWKTHAKQFDKHTKEMKARRELIRNPHLIPTSPTSMKKQTAIRRLKPLKQEANEWPRDADGNVIYDRQIEDIDVQQAAVKAEEEEKEAIVSSFNFSDDFSCDAERAGPSDLIEHTIPDGAEVEQIYQAGHEIDGRQVIVSMDDCNAISSKKATQPTESDDWSSFTAHPPSVLHALLIRTYDLDSTLHSHLYLPFAPLRSLGKTRAERCARIVPLLSFNDEGELFFKQSLIKGQKKKVKRAQPKKEAFVQAHISKIEKKLAEEKEPSSDDHEEPDHEAESEAEHEEAELAQSHELDSECAPVNDDDMRPETAEFAVEAHSEEPNQYDADPEQTVDSSADQQVDDAPTESEAMSASADELLVDDAAKAATQPFTTQVNEPEATDAEFESDPEDTNAAISEVEADSETQATSDAAPAVSEAEVPVSTEAAPQDSEFESDPAQEVESTESAPSAQDAKVDSEPAPVVSIAPQDSEFESDDQPAEADSAPVDRSDQSSVEQEAEPCEPTPRTSEHPENEFESDASEPAAVMSSSKPVTPRTVEPLLEIQQASAKPSPRIPTLSRPTSSKSTTGVSPRLLAVETSRPSSNSGSKPTTPRLAPLPVTPTVVEASPALDRPLSSKASPRLSPISPRVEEQQSSKPASPRPVEAELSEQTESVTDEQPDVAADSAVDFTQPEVNAAEDVEVPANQSIDQSEVVEQPASSAEEESYEDDTHTYDTVAADATEVAASNETSAESTQVIEAAAEFSQSTEASQSAEVQPVVENQLIEEPQATTEQPEPQQAVEHEQAIETEYEDDHHADEPEAEQAIESADKEFPDDE